MNTIIMLVFMALDTDGKIHTQTREFMNTSACHNEAKAIREKIRVIGPYTTTYICVDTMLLAKQS